MSRPISRSMKTTFHPTPLRRALLAAASATLVFGSAQANPVNPTVTHGNATFDASGGTLNITNTPGAIINWQGFSINRGELTRFIQQHGASAVLNRVTGSEVSNILGELQSNGRVFLINPNGIVFGESAVIDTNGFIASTLNMADQDFINGIMRFAGDGGDLINRGMIHVKGNGDIALIAPSVENSGILRSESGDILLAAGRDIEISSAGVDGVTFNIQAPGDSVLNLGKAIAERGALGLFADTVSNRGELTVVQRDGRILLEANDVVASGTITAPGGEIDILGDDIALNGAMVSTVSENDGGRIRIGGDYLGGGGVRTARTTTIDATSTVDASATGNGDGGRMIVWSDVETSVDGTLLARGGPSGGDGGFIETSSKGTLNFSRPADVSAPMGDGGEWLLDPEDIVIGGSEAASISSALNEGSNVTIKTSDGGDGEGNISVNSAITKTAGDDATLAMIAHNRIDINAPITATSGKLNVSLRAGSAIGVHSAVVTNGGSFSTVITGLAMAEEEETLEAEEPVIADETEADTLVVEQPESKQPDATTSNSSEPAAETPETIPSIEESAVAEADTGVADPAAIDISGSVTSSGGLIALDAGADATSAVSGNLDASALDAGEVGGRIEVLGNEVYLLDGSNLNASGDSGGGEILVGGDFQGNNPDVGNAMNTLVESGVTLNADAINDGDGGRIIVWADNTTVYRGDLSARGGEQSGNGGFAEVSGKRNLVFEGDVDLNAENGAGGSLLLDPDEVLISAVGTNDGELSDGEILAADGGNVAFNISTNTIETLLNAGTDLSIQANDRIALQAGSSISATGFGNLSLEAAALDITLDSNITIGGGLDLLTGGQILLGAGVSLTAGGDIQLIQNANLALSSSIASTGGEVTLVSNAGDISLTSNTVQGTNITLISDDLQLNNSTIDASGFVSLQQGGVNDNINIRQSGAAVPGIYDLTETELQSISATGGLIIGRDAPAGSTGQVNFVGGDPIDLTGEDYELTIFASDVNLDPGTTLDLGDDDLIIAPLGTTGTIGLGTGIGTLTLTEAELNQIQTTGLVGVGRFDPATTGAVDIANVDLSSRNYTFLAQGGSISVNNLELSNDFALLNAFNGGITGGAGTDVTATSLFATASGAINLDTSVQNIHAISSGSSIDLLNSGFSNLRVINSSSAPTTGLRADGDISLTHDRNIDVDHDVITTATTGSILLAALDGTDRLNIDAAVSSINGNIELFAAEDLVLEDEADVSTVDGTIDINAGFFYNGGSPIQSTFVSEFQNFVGSRVEATGTGSIDIDAVDTFLLRETIGGATRTNDISVSSVRGSLIDLNGSVVNFRGNSLLVEADRNVDIDTDVNQADIDISGNGDLNLESAGLLTLTDLNSDSHSVELNNGELSITSSGALTVNSEISATSDALIEVTDNGNTDDDILVNAAINSGGGSLVRLRAADDIQINGSGTVGGFGTATTINADRDDDGAGNLTIDGTVIGTNVDLEGANILQRGTINGSVTTTLSASQNIDIESGFSGPVIDLNATGDINLTSDSTTASTSTTVNSSTSLDITADNVSLNASDGTAAGQVALASDAININITGGLELNETCLLANCSGSGNLIFINNGGTLDIDAAYVELSSRNGFSLIDANRASAVTIDTTGDNGSGYGLFIRNETSDANQNRDSIIQGPRAVFGQGAGTVAITTSAGLGILDESTTAEVNNTAGLEAGNLTINSEFVEVISNAATARSVIEGFGQNVSITTTGEKNGHGVFFQLNNGSEGRLSTTVNAGGNPGNLTIDVQNDHGARFESNTSTGNQLQFSGGLSTDITAGFVELVASSGRIQLLNDAGFPANPTTMNITATAANAAGEGVLLETSGDGSVLVLGRGDAGSSLNIDTIATADTVLRSNNTSDGTRISADGLNITTGGLALENSGLSFVTVENFSNATTSDIVINTLGDVGTSGDGVRLIGGANTRIEAEGDLTVNGVADLQINGNLIAGEDLTLSTSGGNINGAFSPTFSDPIQANRLLAEAATGISLLSSVNQADLDNSGFANILFTNLGALTLVDLNADTRSIDANGSLILESLGSLTINDDIVSVGTMQIDARDDGTVNDDINFNANVRTTGGGQEVEITAADNVNFNSGAIVEALNGRLQVNADDDLDGDGDINVIGTARGQSVTLEGFDVNQSGTITATSSVTLDGRNDVNLAAGFAAPSIDLQAVGAVNLDTTLASADVTVSSTTSTDVMAAELNLIASAAGTANRARLSTTGDIGIDVTNGVEITENCVTAADCTLSEALISATNSGTVTIDAGYVSIDSKDGRASINTQQGTALTINTDGDNGSGYGLFIRNENSGTGSNQFALIQGSNPAFGQQAGTVDITNVNGGIGIFDETTSATSFDSSGIESGNITINTEFVEIVNNSVQSLASIDGFGQDVAITTTGEKNGNGLLFDVNGGQGRISTTVNAGGNPGDLIIDVQNDHGLRIENNSPGTAGHQIVISGGDLLDIDAGFAEFVATGERIQVFADQIDIDVTSANAAGQGFLIDSSNNGDVIFLGRGNGNTLNITTPAASDTAIVSSNNVTNKGSRISANDLQITTGGFLVDNSGDSRIDINNFSNATPTDITVTTLGDVGTTGNGIITRATGSGVTFIDADRDLVFNGTSAFSLGAY